MREEIIEDLYKEGIILFGEFKLTSGLMSPYYIDLRLTYSKPRLLKSIIDLYLEALRGVGEFNVVAGIETGSIPLSSIIAYILGKPMVYVRKAPKQVGTGKLIEGEIKEGDVVVVIDDVATTGGSLIRAVNSIRDEKGVVKSAVVFVDREQGAREALKQLGVELIAIFTVTQLFESLFKKGYIDAEVYGKVMRYVSGG